MSAGYDDRANKFGKSASGNTTRLLIVVGAIFAAFIYVHVRAYVLYAGVDIGMTRVEIIEQLGEPRRMERRMIFCDPYFPWDGACPAPRAQSEFLFFKVGIDRWIVVGVNSAGRVWFKTLGDT